MEVSYTYEEFEYPNLERVLKEMGAKMQQYMREKLENHTPFKTNASYNLSNSINYLVEKDGQNYEVSISLEDYWKYVEYGTQPHWVPIKPLKEWVLVKPVIPQVRDGKLPTVDQLAYAVKWKIHEEGTEPQKFFWNSVDEAVEDFEEAVGQAVAKDIDRNVDLMLLTLKF